MVKKRVILLILLAGLIAVFFKFKTEIYRVLFFRESADTIPSPNFVFNKNYDFTEKIRSPQAPFLSEANRQNYRLNSKVDPDRIWRHLENIAGERYAEIDREFTQNYLVEQLQNYGFSPELQPFEEGVNIVAKRPNDDPKAPILLMGAHYDTVVNSPGADDNGSGMAVLLEVARLFGKKNTENALELVFFDLEEPGLLGSFAFAARPENLQNLRRVIVLDMVGYACRVAGCQQYPAGLNVEPLLQANGVSSPDKGEFLAVVGEVQHRDFLASFRGISPGKSGENLPPVVPVPIPLKGALTPDVLRSDHAPFWYQNIPAVLVTDTANLRSPYYHKPTDTLENLDRKFLMGSAQVIVNVVGRLLDK